MRLLTTNRFEKDLKRAIKRSFDVTLAILCLSVSSIPLIVIWLVLAYEHKSNGIYIQERVGKNGKLFSLYKFKSMREYNGVETTITASHNIRITKIGRIIRNTKIDELPQLWNILVGDMSFVGPRPDVPGYADQLKGEDRDVLTVRPGITGPAQLAYKNEEEILARQADPTWYNDEVIWPDKVKINKEYIRHQSILRDIYYIYKTVFG